MNIIVTRHDATRAWLLAGLATKGAGADVICVAHVEDAAALVARYGDAPSSHGNPIRVFGTLPLKLCAELCRLGCECWVVELKVPACLRGRDLDTVALHSLAPDLARYCVRRLGSVYGSMNSTGNTCKVDMTSSRNGCSLCW